MGCFLLIFSNRLQAIETNEKDEKKVIKLVIGNLLVLVNTIEFLLIDTIEVGEIKQSIHTIHSI